MSATAATRVIRTVLGDIDPAALGALNGHEHLFQVSPLLPGDELDDADRSSAEAARLRDSGFADPVPSGQYAHAQPPGEAPWDAPRFCDDPEPAAADAGLPDAASPAPP